MPSWFHALSNSPVIRPWGLAVNCSSNNSSSEIRLGRNDSESHGLSVPQWTQK